MKVFVLFSSENQDDNGEDENDLEVENDENDVGDGRRAVTNKVGTSTSDH